MSRITTADQLKRRILELETLRDTQKRELKEQFSQLKRSLSPAHLIQDTAREVSASPEIKTRVLGAVLGLAVGYLFRRAFFGRAHGVKKLAGTLVQMGVAGTVSRNADTIKSLGSRLLKNFFSRKQRKNDQAVTVYKNGET